MGRLLVLLTTVLALAVPAGLLAADGTDGTLSIKRGRALVVFDKLQGTAIGRMAAGKVRIRVLRPKVDTPPEFHHCRKRMVNRTTTVCQGKKLTFRALNGHYVIRLEGSGIFLSAAGQGSGETDGAGIMGLSNGVMSLDNGPYGTIPDDPTPFTIGTPPPPPQRR
ncbi:MAG: hypothetical protein ACXVRD_12530 [Gaiellaceae bacterium]